MLLPVASEGYSELMSALIIIMENYKLLKEF